MGNDNIFDDLNQTVNGVHHPDRATYKRFKANAIARGKNYIAANEDRVFRDNQIADNKQKEEARRIASAANRDDELTRIHEREAMKEDAKTERERIRQETKDMKIRAQAEARAAQVSTAREIQSDAIKQAKNHAAVLDEYAHPAKHPLALGKLFDSSTGFSADGLKAISGLQYLYPKAPPEPIPPKHGLNIPSDIRIHIYPAKNEEFFEGFREHYDTVLRQMTSRMDWEKVHHYVSPLHIPEPLIIQQQAVVKTFYTGIGLKKRIAEVTAEYLAEQQRLRDELYNNQIIHDAENNVDALIAVGKSFIAYRPAEESALQAEVDTYNGSVSSHETALVDYEEKTIAVDAEIAAFADKYQEFFKLYEQSEASGVLSYFKGIALHSLTGHTSSENSLLQTVLDTDGHLVVDYVLPEFEPPAFKDSTAVIASESVTDVPLTPQDIKEVLHSAQHELPIRMARELVALDYAEHIRCLTINCWRRGLLLGNKEMKGLSCCQTFTCTPDEVRGYQNPAGFLRAIGGVFSENESTDIIPEHTSVTDGQLDFLSPAGVNEYHMPRLFQNAGFAGLITMRVSP